MSRVVKVNQGDYIIHTRDGGNILLDTGGAGAVTITGNLDVLGTTTSVGANDLVVTDNTITLNAGETGAGVTRVTAGVEIDRGSLNDAVVLWTEAVQHYDPVAGSNVDGTFELRLKSGNLSGLRVGSIGAGSANLSFDMSNGSNVLKIVNSVNYESRVLSTNDIPNRKFVTDYVSASGGTANVDKIFAPVAGGYASATAKVVASSTSVDISINSTLKASVTAAGLSVNNVRIAGDTVTNTSVTNLTLTSTNNNVEVKSIMNLDNVETLSGSYDTTVVSGTTKIYTSETEGPGRSGIYFMNDSTYGGNAYNNDELVSKNRAVLLSILL